MFDFVFSSRQPLRFVKSLKAHTHDKENGIIPVVWTEHCIECSAPRCYVSCQRFSPRRDGHCVRIANGITPTSGKPAAVEVNFLPWSKIECLVSGKPTSSSTYFRIYKAITILGVMVDFAARHSPAPRVRAFLYDGWFSARQKFLSRLGKGRLDVPLVLTASISGIEKPVSLLIDLISPNKLLFRQKAVISPSRNTFAIDIPPYADMKTLTFLNIHPADAEENVRLVFEKLILRTKNANEGKKAKLVVWDLDNTLWDGILVENSGITLRQDFAELIKELDSKGIVNSIASKNNFEQAWAKLQSMKLDEFFVFPKINWEPKSVNLAKTIQQMNINPDTVVFVDDNPVERHEINLRMPSVTTVAPEEITALSKGKRFDVIVTDDARKRRGTYRMLESMQKEEDAWDGDYNDFIAHCKIELKVSHPTAQNIGRCHELLQRTNQLNSSGRRLSYEEVCNMAFNDDSSQGYVLQAADKFGDYGIVGFLLTSTSGKTPRITDFVISCRVANRKIEPTLINALANMYGGKIEFCYKNTGLNEPMHRIIDELSMIKEAELHDTTIYLHNYNPEYPHIVSVSFMK